MLQQADIDAIISSIRTRLKDNMKGLEFEPTTHTYTYNGRVLIPVSEVCKIFERGFDSDYWSKIKARESGKSQAEILHDWKQNSEKACDEGTNVHSYAEWRFHKTTGHPIEDDIVQAIDDSVSRGALQKDSRMKCVDEIWEALSQGEIHSCKYYPIASENRILNPELGYAGTFDLLCLRVNDDDTVGLVIFDYKTNGNLFNIFKQRGCDLDKMKHPISHLAACNAANYTCQLNLYQLGIERCIDIPVVDRILLWVEPSGVYAIDANNGSVYSAVHQRLERLGKKSKWKYSSYYIQDIEGLKHFYRFHKQGSFGLLHLPEIKTLIHNHLKTLA